MPNKPSWKSQYTNISELQINLAKGRIAGPYTQSGSPEGSMRPVSQYFTVGRHVLRWNMPLAISYIWFLGLWYHASNVTVPDGILISLSVFAQLTYVPNRHGPRCMLVMRPKMSTCIVNYTEGWYDHSWLLLIYVCQRPVTVSQIQVISFLFAVVLSVLLKNS